MLVWSLPTNQQSALSVIVHSQPGWQVTWYSDEVRNWWLNGFQGQLEVAPDLSQLSLVGLCAFLIPGWIHKDDFGRVAIRIVVTVLRHVDVLEVNMAAWIFKVVAQQSK